MVLPQNVSYELLNKNISVMCGIAMESPSSPKQYGLFPLLLAAHQSQTLRHYCRRHCMFYLQNVKKSSWSQPGNSFSDGQLSGYWKCCMGCQRTKDINNLIQPWTLHATGILPGMMYPLVQKLSDFIRIITIFLTGFEAQSSGRNSLMVLQT